jgi:hypothetical protein
MWLLELIKDAISNTLSITALVIIMLLLVEYLHVYSSGKWMESLRKKPFFQIIVAALLGIIPGCIGGFAVVSLFTHKMFSFGALIAGMISGFGDESFVMIAVNPKQTIILAGVLLAIAIPTGYLVHFLFKEKEIYEEGHPLPLHRFDCFTNHSDGDEHQPCGGERYHRKKHRQKQNISFHRAILLFGIGLYLFFLLTGTLAHQHAVMPSFTNSLINKEFYQTETNGEHEHNSEILHVNAHDASDQDCHNVFSWENVVFILLAIATFFIVAFSSEHFLQHHLWKHVIKQHFRNIFLWTLSVLFCVQLLLHFIDFEQFIEANQWSLFLFILAAILVGLIPESGPHLIFVILFLNGSIPFSILLVNSIVQDGHGALPLLAESRLNFLKMKGIKVVIALLVGLLGFWMKF